MKILYFNVIEENSGWGAEYFLNNSFNNIGVKTINIDYRKNKKCLIKKTLGIEEDFDLMFLQRGDYFKLDIIKSINKPKIFYYSELISRCNDADHIFKSNLFDYYLVRGFGCKKILLDRKWLKKEKIGIHLSAFDPNTYYKKNIKKNIDVLFVGALTPRRKAILEKLNNAGLNITAKSAYAKEANNLFNRAKILLNIHSEEYLDTETRIFEALGSGVFLLTEKLAKENPFKDKEHLVEVSTIEQMIEKIKYYLKNTKERERIAHNGNIENIKKHTYDARALELKNIFEKYLNKSNINQLSQINKQKLKKYLIKENLSNILEIINLTVKKIWRRIFK